MPSEKEKQADLIARVLAESFDAVTLRNHDDPVDVSRIHRDIADDVISALSAAEKEREGEAGRFADGGTRTFRWGEDGQAREVGREGDIIEKLREWAEERRRRVAVSSGENFRLGANVALDGLLAFLNDLQEQSTGGEG